MKCGRLLPPRTPSRCVAPMPLKSATRPQLGVTAMAETNILWRYTFLPHLESILRDGLIRPATALVEPPERPIVWFSKNQFWERTVTKSMKFSDGRSIELDFKGMVKHGVFPVRIGVLPETAPYDWLGDIEASQDKEQAEKVRLMHAAASQLLGLHPPLCCEKQKWTVICVTASAQRFCNSCFGIKGHSSGRKVTDSKYPTQVKEHRTT